MTRVSSLISSRSIRAPRFVDLAVLLVVVGLVACASSVALARAGDPAYLAQMPSPALVLEKTKGTDQFDTWARQYATFQRLVSIQGNLEGSRQFGNETPNELSLTALYNHSAAAISGLMVASLPPGDPQSKRKQWFDREAKYEFDPGFNSQLLARFFSPSFAAAYSKAHAADVQRIAHSPAGAKPVATNAPAAPTKKASRFHVSAKPWFVGLAFFFSVWLIFLLRRAVTPFFRIDANDPREVRLGPRRYTLTTLVGRVTDLQSRTSVSSSHSSSGWGYGYRSSSSVNVMQLVQAMVTDAAGVATPVQVGRFPVAVGQDMSAVWAFRRKRRKHTKSGEHLLFRNYTTRQTEMRSRTIGNMARFGGMPLLPLSGLQFLVLHLVAWATVPVVFVLYGICVFPIHLRRKRQFVRHLESAIVPDAPAPATTVALV